MSFCNFYSRTIFFAKCLSIAAVSFLIFSNTYAQKVRVFGYVLDSSTYSPIPNAEVTNTRTNKKVNTNEKGQFQLIATPGDRLFISANRYHFKQEPYSLIMQDTIVIYLATLPHELPGVTVTAAGYTKYQHDSMARLKEFNENLVSKQYDLIQKNDPSKPGLNFNLGYFDKKEKSKRREAEAFEQREKDAYVNYRFSPELVQAYTGLKGDTLNQFRMKYYPDYEWLRKHPTDEDIFYYINDKIKLFYRDIDRKK